MAAKDSTTNVAAARPDPAAGRRAGAAPAEKITGPVPMHHRLKLGQDVLNDPQGAGPVSGGRSSISNGGSSRW